MLFKAIIVVYRENRTKPINAKCRVADCSSRWDLYLTLAQFGLNVHENTFEPQSVVLK
jgi:hypothetical protein